MGDNKKRFHFKRDEMHITVAPERLQANRCWSGKGLKKWRLLNPEACICLGSGGQLSYSDVKPLHISTSPVGVTSHANASVNKISPIREFGTGLFA